MFDKMEFPIIAAYATVPCPSPMTVYTLPVGTVSLCSRGDATIRLKLHRTEPRMVTVLTFTDRMGRPHAVELTTDDVVRVAEDLSAAFDADKRTVTKWYSELRRRETVGGQRDSPRTRGSCL